MQNNELFPLVLYAWSSPLNDEQFLCRKSSPISWFLSRTLGSFPKAIHSENEHLFSIHFTFSRIQGLGHYRQPWQASEGSPQGSPGFQHHPTSSVAFPNPQWRGSSPQHPAPSTPTPPPPPLLPMIKKTRSTQ